MCSRCLSRILERPACHRQTERNPKVSKNLGPRNRAADLGLAGIYYRALVGRFASAEKATKLCSGLKAAGGDCIILKY
jgi:hypothetical protein